MQQQAEQNENMIPEVTLENLPEDLILEICKRLPVRNRFVLRGVSRLFRRLALKNVEGLNLQTYGTYRDVGVGAAIDVLELVAEASGPSALIDLRVCEPDPTDRDAFEHTGCLDWEIKRPHRSRKIRQVARYDSKSLYVID